jgi:hypothetical protein
MVILKWKALMRKIIILSVIVSSALFASCENKNKSDANTENTDVNHSTDSLGTDHKNTPVGSETDTFGTNPEK